MINRRLFFKHVRAALFSGKMSPGQVDGIGFILDSWEAMRAAGGSAGLAAGSAAGPAAGDDRWLAYVLATAFHETAFTMQPIREFGGPGYYFRMYDPASPLPDRAALARRMRARPGDGVVFYGRGYVQLTWRTNYEKMGSVFGVDLTSSAKAADAALDAALAAKIMLRGMIEGSFTGRKLSGYFNDARADWRGARRIINGLDRAQEIAAYGRKFHAAIGQVRLSA